MLKVALTPAIALALYLDHILAKGRDRIPVFLKWLTGVSLT